MTGKQVVTVVMGVAVLWTAASTFSEYNDNEQKKLEEKNRHELTMSLGGNKE